ncbi:microtubule-actin cross-linking factor 1-like [Salmo trutta]|uniref:microtubule-actin cross-linking factor 1-like n=1 Tax=Salmo trutta TaxID=8032 RepID=UPI0011310517|nr:microtubule-actin cross-linking factor 1-like [Salmo trutta]
MESSDEETLSERSCVSERSERSLRSERSGGSLSPCPSGPQGPPGDTLPWNRPSRHERGERRKRKTHDSVLDPAERAVVRVGDERDRVQKKTFMKWVNKHLIKVRYCIAASLWGLVGNTHTHTHTRWLETIHPDS